MIKTKEITIIDKEYLNDLSKIKEAIKTNQTLSCCKIDIDSVFYL